ncbi:hypothetical protein NDU88_000259 [Pleurodeles waltl]|uniref:Uncharacterized protein n=1 Tax=Pleurodeles waltl TaxID=8319 RepID=A0AAV7SW30_PLEWA|nr:hypothetical protein NDU88_000259 [Pleurodeles waltl]
MRRACLTVLRAYRLLVDVFRQGGGHIGDRQRNRLTADVIEQKNSEFQRFSVLNVSSMSGPEARMQCQDQKLRLQNFTVH